MKHLFKTQAPLLILAIGIALAAAGGARLGKLDFAMTLAKGQQQLGQQNIEQPPTRSEPVDPDLRLQNWIDVSGGLFGIGMLLIITGSVMARRRQSTLREEASNVDAPDDLPAALRQMASDIRLLGEALSAESPDMAAIRTHIEEVQMIRLDPILASRQSLEQQFGLAGFAELVGPLSSVERFLNRTWTVLVDHHLDEARKSIAMASDSMDITLAVYEQLANSSVS
ncbi:MAG: hypothetical protein O3B72_11955 [Proteobacteria bacterium]|nr:hypothetical protein [Pseudomonadota bacterium]